MDSKFICEKCYYYEGEVKPSFEGKCLFFEVDILHLYEHGIDVCACKGFELDND
jgi:hypothetical protein